MNSYDFYRWIIISILVVITNAGCTLPLDSIQKQPYHRPSISLPDLEGCCGEAKQAVLNAIKADFNVAHVMTSSTQSKATDISGGGGGTSGASGKVSQSTSESAMADITFGDIRWTVYSRGCNCNTYSVAEGNDRGWGQGRDNSGYCQAEVTCTFR